MERVGVWVWVLLVRCFLFRVCFLFVDGSIWVFWGWRRGSYRVGLVCSGGLVGV